MEELPMGLPDLDSLNPLPEPMEILDMMDGQTTVLHVLTWELGKTFINPRDGRDPRWVPVLRLHVPGGDKPTIPHYWDVTAKTLVNGLLGYLERGDERRYRFKVTKHGRPPMARFTLDTIPAA